MATSVVNPRAQFFADNGRPLIGGRIHTYVAGSSTRARTYKDAAKAQPNTNPIVLDGRGEAQIYLAEGVEYKFVIEDSKGALIYTQEPVYGAIWPNAEDWPGDATLSYKYMAEAKAAVDAMGITRAPYDTYAQALGDLGNMTEGDRIEVSIDETHERSRTRYKVENGELVFVANLDQVRADLASIDDPDLGVAMVGGVIAKSTTIHVPSQFSTIQAAMDYLRGFNIARNALVTIKVASGSHSLTSGVSLNHSNGESIRLIGNQTDLEQCRLVVDDATAFDVLVANQGHRFGFIDGFLIERSAKAGPSKNFTGILAADGAFIRCGPNIRVNNFYYSFAARNGSTMYCPEVVSENAGDVGIWAFCGSFIYAREATAIGASDLENNLGYGFQAEYGSSIDCSDATASGCRIAGVAALSNSQARAYGANSSSNTGSGFLARDGGGIICHNGIANNNGRYGLERISDGVIDGGNVTATGNTLGDGFAKAFLSSDSGARLAANRGPLRLDTSTADPIYFNSSGGLQFGIDHTDNATSALRARGGGAWSGDQPALTAAGSATDIGIRYVTKGAGTHYFSAYGGVVQFDIAAIQNCVNRLSAQGGGAGKAVSIRAVGSDAVIDLAIFPKGSGSYVQIGSGWVSNPTLSPNGYIYIKDASGTVRKLMTCD